MIWPKSISQSLSKDLKYDGEDVMKQDYEPDIQGSDGTPFSKLIDREIENKVAAYRHKLVTSMIAGATGNLEGSAVAPVLQSTHTAPSALNPLNIAKKIGTTALSALKTLNPFAKRKDDDPTYRTIKAEEYSYFQFRIGLLIAVIQRIISIARTNRTIPIKAQKDLLALIGVRIPTHFLSANVAQCMRNNSNESMADLGKMSIIFDRIGRYIESLLTKTKTRVISGDSDADIQDMSLAADEYDDNEYDDNEYADSNDESGVEPDDFDLSDLGSIEYEQ
jgi:hypothetical protein